jgi:hypothetical protein
MSDATDPTPLDIAAILRDAERLLSYDPPELSLSEWWRLHRLLGAVPALVARVRELEAGLGEALPFVWPDTQSLVREFSDLDFTDAAIRERCNGIRALRLRLANLLAAGEPKEGA